MEIHRTNVFQPSDLFTILVSIMYCEDADDDDDADIETWDCNT